MQSRTEAGQWIWRGVHLLRALQRGHDDNLILDAGNGDDLTEGVVQLLCEAAGRQREREAPGGGHHHIQRHHAHERAEFLLRRHALCPVLHTTAVSAAATHCLMGHAGNEKLCCLQSKEHIAKQRATDTAAGCRTLDMSKYSAKHCSMFEQLACCP